MCRAEKCSRDIHSQSSPPLPVSVNSVGKEVSRSNSSTIPASVSCYRCGARHYASDCKFKSVVCNNCGKLGHLAKVCHSTVSLRDSKVVKMVRLEVNVRHQPLRHKYSLGSVTEIHYSTTISWPKS